MQRDTLLFFLSNAMAFVSGRREVFLKGSVKALLTFYYGSVQALLRLGYDPIKALLSGRRVAAAA